MVELIALTAFLTAVLLAIALGRGITERRTRLRARVEGIAGLDQAGPAELGTLRLLRLQNYSKIPFLQSFLRGNVRAERIADDLDRAAVPLRVGEYLIVRVVVGVILALGARLYAPPGLAGIGLVALAFLVGLLIPKWFVGWRIARRRAQVEAALPDALSIISRGLRAGSGLLSSIDALVEQSEGVIAEEFARARQEIGAGLSIEQAFVEMSRRVDSKDLNMVVTAIVIQREVGGNLAEILDNTATTIRERFRLRAEMKSLTSRQRLSAYLIAVVPIGILLLFITGDSDTIRPMLETNTGHIMLAIAGALEVGGVLIIRQLLASFEV